MYYAGCPRNQSYKENCLDYAGRPQAWKTNLCVNSVLGLLAQRKAAWTFAVGLFTCCIMMHWMME
jgi:hypothetical protein